MADVGQEQPLPRSGTKVSRSALAVYRTPDRRRLLSRRKQPKTSLLKRGRFIASWRSSRKSSRKWVSIDFQQMLREGRSDSKLRLPPSRLSSITLRVGVTVKFEAGDEIDNDHCTVLTHEFLRCDDAFKEFCKYAEQMIIQGQTRELSYKAYNAYTSFIHHLYEFLMGCHARDAKNTDITNKRGDQRIKIIEGYVMHHAQRIMDQYRDSIRNGTAPSWVNHISCYEITVPSDFAKDFREFRNKAVGHVAYERASTLSLSVFYQKYHKFLYLLYRESIYWWGKRSEEFPNLKEITDFSVTLVEENAYSGAQPRSFQSMDATR